MVEGVPWVLQKLPAFIHPVGGHFFPPAQAREAAFLRVASSSTLEFWAVPSATL